MGPGPSIWRPTPADPAELFAADHLARARRYQRPVRRVRAARLVARAALLVAVVAGDLGGGVVEVLGVDGWAAQLVVVLLVIELLVLAVDVPFGAWLDLRHDRRWGVSTHSAAGFARDEAFGAAVSFALGVALLVPVYAVVRATPWWWVWAWVLTLAWVVVGGLLVPVVVAPLFNRLEPVADPALTARLQAVSQRAGVRVSRVVVADESRRSRRDDAYVAGIGPTRRIVLYDNLLDTSPELVEQVVAHELGHVRHHHLVRQLPVLGAAALVLFVVLGALGRWDQLFAWLGLDGPGDPTGLPFVLLVVGVVGAVVSLVPAWVSRAFEREADRDAVEVLARPDRAEAMLRRVHVRNLADLDPGRLDRLRASHPPVAERIAFVRASALPSRSGSSAA